MRKTTHLKGLFLGLMLSLTMACEEEEPEIPNNPPTVANAIIDLNLQAGFGEKEITIGSVFTDEDGDELSYTVSSSNPEVVVAQVGSDRLVISEVATGQSTITLTADDGNQGLASDSFLVTVAEVEVNNAPMVKTALEDLELEVGFQTHTLSLSEVFEDVDGDELTLAVSSSNEQVATASLDGTDLNLFEQGEGSTTIEIIAKDPKGESASDSFVLTLVDSSPVVANAPEDLSLTEGFQMQQVDLTDVFSDPTGEGLSYELSSSDEQVATVSILEGAWFIIEQGTGTTDISVVAYNNQQKSASTSFTLTIETQQYTVEEITLNFGNTSGNSLYITYWNVPQDIDGLAIVISDQQSFTALTDGEEPSSSITYLGDGQQVVYLGNQSAEFEILLLQAQTTYYFQVYTYTGDYVWSDAAHTVQNNTTESCGTTSTSISEVCFDYSTPDVRTISSNQYPSHAVGNFPNADPTAIEVTRSFDMNPAQANAVTYVYDETGPPTPSNQNFYQFGMAINGVEFHPMGLKPWTNPNTQEENWEWQAQVSEEGQTHLDAYGAHVTSQGNYHYHGDIVGLANTEDGSKHSQLYGFAGDGFPIYYKYGYVSADDPSSGIKELTSSYQLKSGTRTGTGTAGADYPDGSYDGTYIQDFEYVQGLGDLDECNGRTGVTPEFPNGTYYYVITTDFPVTPNCFVGTPDADWIIGK
ncbi:YHYH protein [Reichenbachiella ulvae]|uniref:YHYH protein n=1 Tax=Reichenbachiella ulvae TaxID=2980104 RepID=A0ABT3CS65_9BACT|nr:YHYH protein [Reichenbachiella ulvae]MCV9386523.1 YHYH protein [Reichenbachiella ulvae]